MNTMFPSKLVLSAAPRFYYPAVLHVGGCIEVSSAVLHHIHVLRLAVGDVVTLFDGQGAEFTARLSQLGKKHATLTVELQSAISRESPCSITLVQAISSGERMDWTLQKATELGVTRIIPVQSTRSVVRLSGERASKRVQHWQQVVISACEQCGRNLIPEVTHIHSVSEVCAWLQVQHSPAYYLSPYAQQRLRELTPVTALSLIAGAEGGWSTEEEDALLAVGSIPLLFGARVLRTETAPLALLAAIQSQWGDC